MINLGSLAHVVSRAIAEQVRDELTEVLGQESDALRREIELKDKQIRLMAIRCAMYCTVSECCPKQPVDGKFDKETCYKCQTERSAKAAQAGKDGAE